MRVLIADDEPIARQVLRELLEECPGVEIAGEAASGTETIRQVERLDPDLVLLDIHMPHNDGLAVARRLRPLPLPLVIYVTAYEQHALAAFEAGAVDYLLKPVRLERLRALFRKHQKLTRGEIMRILRISPNTATKDLKILCEEGLIERVEPSSSTRTHYFRLASGIRPETGQ